MTKEIGCERETSLENGLAETTIVVFSLDMP